MRGKVIPIGVAIAVVMASIILITWNDKKAIASYEEGNTLYVGGTGAGNYSSIQEAIDNAENGDTIIVYDGVYEENLFINKSIAIIGSTILNTTYLNVTSGWAIVIAASNVSISNMVICGNGTAVGGIKTSENGTYNNITIHDCIIENFIDCGIRLGNKTAYTYGHSLYRLEIFNMSTGIQLANINESRLNNSFIHDAYFMGLELLNSSKNVIEKCNISMNGNGIHLLGSHHNTMESLVVSDNCGGEPYSGISLDFSCNNTISGSKIYGNCDAGIDIFSSNNNTIEYTDIYYNDGYGIWIHTGLYYYRGWAVTESCSNNTIMYSNITSNLYDGISIEGGENNSVIGCNIAYNSGYGVSLWYSNYNLIAYCNISYNSGGIDLQGGCYNEIIYDDIYENAGMAECGISMWDTYENVISNCLIYANDEAGIWATYSYNDTINNCTIYENYNAGVILNESESFVENNTFYNNTYDIANINSYCVYDFNTFGYRYPTTASFIDYDGNFVASGVDYPPPDESGYANISKYIDIIADGWLWLFIYYDDSELGYVMEDTLKIWMWEEEWYENGWNGSRYLDMVNNIVGVNITYGNSVFAPLGIPNIPPIANFTYSPSEPTDLDTISFTDLSYDMDGYIVNWTWDFGDGSISYKQNPSHQYADDGYYNVSLTVMDDLGATATITKQIYVANVPPVAIIKAPSKTFVNETVIFDGSLSYDLDGYIVNYSWDFGDGSYGYGMICNHTYTAKGIYNVTLTVTDDDGSYAVNMTNISVYSCELDINQSVFNRGISFYGDMQMGQSFIPTKSILCGVKLYIKKIGNPGNITLYIKDALEGKILAKVEKTPDEIPTTFAWVKFKIPHINLSVGTPYYIVLHVDGNRYNHYSWGFGMPNPYANGIAYIYRGRWVGVTYIDFCFKTYGVDFSQPP